MIVVALFLAIVPLLTVQQAHSHLFAAVTTVLDEVALKRTSFIFMDCY